jgi:hypothetical protein
MSFPKIIPRRSVHPLERLNGEIKRHTDFVGIFSNEGAIARLIGSCWSNRMTNRLFSAPGT